MNRSEPRGLRAAHDQRNAAFTAAYPAIDAAPPADAEIRAAKGMTGLLPPLPPHIARRDHGSTPVPALPLPVSRYDAGDGVTIEAANHQRTQWAVRCSGECLNKRLTWEPERTPSERGYDFLARCRWPSAEEAYAALQASRSTATES